jgi:hypothetical protein
MRPEDVLFKYLNYGHPKESPLTMALNISSDILNTTHVMFERNSDCAHRIRLIKETKMTVKDLPLLLQDSVSRQRFKHLFYDYDEFYALLDKNSVNL